MKTLYIVRHAKSSWDDASLADFDRPLNERGKRDAPRMGKRLKKRNITVDLMLSSPAKRALSTCKRIADELDYTRDKIVTTQDLYHADEDEIMEVLTTIADHHNTVMIFGHNPGLTDFVNELMDVSIDNIPTCGVAACSLDITSWKDIGAGKGQMLFFDYPKRDKY